MPTYEYRCKDCGQHIEVVQSFTDDSLTECGACGGALRKVFGSIGIAFKGSGFYKTDSRTAAKAAASANGKDKDKDKAKDGTDKAASAADGKDKSSKEASPKESPAKSATTSGRSEAKTA